MDIMATKTIMITLDYIRSLKPSSELADNIEKAMLETRKAKMRKVDLMFKNPPDPTPDIPFS